LTVFLHRRPGVAKLVRDRTGGQASIVQDRRAGLPENVRRYPGDPATRDDSLAVKALERAVEIRKTQPDWPAELALPLVLLGAAYTVERRLAAGRPLLEDGLALYRHAGDRRGEAFALRELGRHADRRGDLVEGARYHALSVSAYEKIRDNAGLGLSVEAAGDNQIARHDPAAASFTRSTTIWRSLGDHIRGGVSLLKLAEALTVSGRAAEAATHQATAEQLLAGTDIPDADFLRAMVTLSGHARRPADRSVGGKGGWLIIDAATVDRLSPTAPAVPWNLEGGDGGRGAFGAAEGPQEGGRAVAADGQPGQQVDHRLDGGVRERRGWDVHADR